MAAVAVLYIFVAYVLEALVFLSAGSGWVSMPLFVAFAISCLPASLLFFLPLSWTQDAFWRVYVALPIVNLLLVFGIWVAVKRMAKFIEAEVARLR